MNVRAVFDCMIYLQAVTNGAGPAAACFLQAQGTRKSNSHIDNLRTSLIFASGKHEGRKVFRQEGVFGEW